jgi:hypothetical protein
VSGASLPHLTDHAAPIDEEADARPRPLVAVEPPALQGLPVGVHGHGEAELVVLDVAAHALDIERLGVLVAVHADHDHASAAVLLVETVQGRRGGAAERQLGAMNQRTSTALPRRSSNASGSELN